MFWNKNKKYNILVLGNDGMLGYELYNELKRQSSFKYGNIGVVIGLDIKDGIDLTKRHALGNYFMNSIHFDYCINCVAYTDTKSTETTKEGRILDYKLNALAPKYIAESCKYWKTKLIHISTDYVFSENSDSYNSTIEPNKFNVSDETFPINIYGYDKLLGEYGIKEIFGNDSHDYTILRTSWIYGIHKNKSFIHKFLKVVKENIKEGKNECDMTLNEYSVPTSCNFVIQCILDTIKNHKYGILHAVPMCTKGISRYEFAEKILEYIKPLIKDDINLIDFKLNKIARDSYWPKYSAMQSSFPFYNWDEMLKIFIESNKQELVKFLIENKGK